MPWVCAESSTYRFHLIFTAGSMVAAVSARHGSRAHGWVELLVQGQPRQMDSPGCSPVTIHRLSDRLASWKRRPLTSALAISRALGVEVLSGTRHHPKTPQTTLVGSTHD